MGEKEGHAPHTEEKPDQIGVTTGLADGEDIKDFNVAVGLVGWIGGKPELDKIAGPNSKVLIDGELIETGDNTYIIGLKGTLRQRTEMIDWVKSIQRRRFYNELLRDMKKDWRGVFIDGLGLIPESQENN